MEHRWRVTLTSVTFRTSEDCRNDFKRLIGRKRCFSHIKFRETKEKLKKLMPLLKLKLKLKHPRTPTPQPQTGEAVGNGWMDGFCHSLHQNTCFKCMSTISPSPSTTWINHMSLSFSNAWPCPSVCWIVWKLRMSRKSCKLLARECLYRSPGLPYILSMNSL